MIVGLGVDIVELERMRALHARFGARLAERLLAPSEWPQFERAGEPARLIAKRFAVKEAAGKALGSGLGRGVRFADIVTEHDAHGAPRLVLSGRARGIADELGVAHAHVSLSDERTSVVALVVLEA
ncbi:MAG: holo-ACP synthase [Halofilum sp. (in: g-proteobacteria)]